MPETHSGFCLMFSKKATAGKFSANGANRRIPRQKPWLIDGFVQKLLVLTAFLKFNF
jgi:hypothetical protein